MNLIESDIQANSLRLHVYRTATQKPPLVFAHGMSDNGLCYWPIARHFADHFEIILYDARSHGLSEETGPDGASTLDRAHDLAGLVKVLGLDKPFMIGHSMGAVTISLFAGLYPDLPGRIVLEDPPPFRVMAATSEEALEGRKQWRNMAAENKQKSIEELIDMNRRENPNWPEAERLPWAQSKQQFSLAAFDEHFVGSETGGPIVAKITCPTLLITADLDKGAIYPPAAAKAWVATLPSGKHIHIAGAGHNIRREQPDVFVQALRGFLYAA
ncbi:MAG: alpha/beta hydrolase [Anaerolineales bacterium]|nr:alpha/beta hydrolase [Anaerolineales bacterium]